MTLLVPRVNESREAALVLWARHGMSSHERRRRRLTHTLHGSSVRTAAALRKATEQQVCVCVCTCTHLYTHAHFVNAFVGTLRTV